MATKAGKLGAVFASTGASIPLVNEPCSNPSADLTNYQVTLASRRYLDRLVAVTIQVSTNGGSTWGAPAATFTVQYVGGWIRFPSAQAAATIVRLITGNYWTMTQLANASEWELNIDTELLDSTVFGNLVRTFVPTIRGGSGRFKQFWLDQTMYTAYLATGTALIVQLYIDTSTGARFECYAWISADALADLEATLFGEDVTFQMDGDIYWIP